MTWKRRLVIFLLIYLPFSLVVSTVGGYYWLRSSLPQLAGEIRLDGLHEPVEVIRDTDGVPHIFAKRDTDAYFALGFVHAQDRLWQMESIRRLGAGRLSEVYGSPAMVADRFVRLFKIYRTAESQLARLTAKERAIVDAYTAGVNGFLENRGGALPPEFQFLRYTPEPWKPADSLTWARIMAFRLAGNTRDETLRIRFSQRLDEKQIEELWPGGKPGDPVTLEASRRAAALRYDNLWRAWPEQFTPVDASNAWVIAGTRTTTGKPILANDPHLKFAAPIVWYLAHIEAPGLSLTGATVPGMPFLFLGHNSRIAWGLTTTGSDTKDLFLEAVDPDDSGHYLTPAGPQPFITRDEIINVRSEDPVTMTVRETRHGPVYSDIFDKLHEVLDDTMVVALATPATRMDDRTAHALFGINRATDWESFIAAARSFDAPQANLFYADTGGDIGLVAPGRIPIRKKGDGRTIAPGAKGTYDWTGFVPFDGLPQLQNPASGLIVNANNRLVGENFPHLLAVDWPPSFRAERIIEAIGDRNDLSPDFSGALQTDTMSLAARRMTPLLTSARPRNDRERQAVDLLRAWDHRMDRTRPEPAIYTAWMFALSRAIVADELDEKLFASIGGPHVRFIESALTRNTHWCDDVTTTARETCAAQISIALARALERIAETQGEDIGNWRWDRPHRAEFKHQLFTHLPGLRAFGDLGIATDGGDHTVNRGRMRGGQQTPFTHSHGAGYRAVYDLSDLSRSRFMIATGQSGNPFSPFYDNLMARWRDGGFIRIAGNRDTLRKSATGILVLRP